MDLEDILSWRNSANAGATVVIMNMLRHSRERGSGNGGGDKGGGGWDPVSIIIAFFCILFFCICIGLILIEPTGW